MKYTRKDIEDLRIEVNFQIEKADYDSALQKKLAEQQKTAQFKGFRKGKVPFSMIKKMYGNSILADVINDVLGKEMESYFSKEGIKYLGEPMLADGHDPLDIDINKPGDYSFTFDLGLRPEFEINGGSETDIYERLAIEIDDKTIDGELDVLRRRAGKQEPVTEDIQESDIMTIEAVELDGKKVKEKGWETTFTIMVDQIADEKLRKQILKKKQGADFDFNIYTLEKDRDEAFVKKYFLNLDENEEKEIGQEFSGKIKEVKRLLLAEMNEEFFTSNFGDKATDEKTAKEFIREQLSLFYSNEAMQLVYRDVMDKMMNTTKLDLPVSFLEKWLKSQDKNKDLPEIELKNQLETFLKEMRWSLIKSQLSEKYEIDVTEEEVKQRLYSKAQQYMTSQMQGFSDPTMLNQIFEYLAKDQNQVNQSADEVATDKVFGKLKDIVTLEDKKVSLEEFKDIVKALNQQIEAEKNAQ
mgnify:CR=1 FL=1|jgi:trigger factor